VNDAAPWPLGERAETPAGFRTPEHWWRELHPNVQKQWAPILRAMTPAQRAQFHLERRKVGRGLPDEHDRFFKQRSLEARDRLLEKWLRIVAESQKVRATL
jgi:hypothetical protein